MEFRIADTFTDSLARLTADEQKASKTTAFDLQTHLASGGHAFHKLDRAKDKNFWSVRVNDSIRIIVHRTGASMLLCYVDHHDKAYAWAERRKIEAHPKTGAAQIVEIRETIREIVVPRHVSEPAPIAVVRRLFDAIGDEDLLSFGVPEEWLADVRAATDDSLLAVAEHLPAEAAEALLQLATGAQPRAPQPAARGSDPFEHPDAQRRFRVMTNVEELQRALEYPWDKWTIFLHPEQRQWVDRDYAGPARVSGSAGTGKTIVALHRAVHLARANEHARVLLTTFSDTLANALRHKLRILIGNEPRLGERIDVCALDAVAQRLHRAHRGPSSIASAADVAALLREASAAVGGHKFSQAFLVSEWDQIVDAWQIDRWEAYRDVARLGRKTRLPEPQRTVLWSIFERVRAALGERKLITRAGRYAELASAFASLERKPYDFAVIDEAQDVSIAQLRFLAVLGGDRQNALFFAGDPGQRIFQQPFSWKSLGVDVRGRSRNLKVNYRTSHQIRTQADRLLEPEVVDVDGNVERRSGTVSVFNGPSPTVSVCSDEAEECSAVATWLRQSLEAGIVPHECAVFVRSAREHPRAAAALKAAGLPFKTLDDRVESQSGYASLCTMHLAKGLEFRVVAVMACDDEIIPSQERIETVGDDSDLKEVYDTERHLLYVACTRARDHLLITGVEPASEFLDDLNG